MRDIWQAWLVFLLLCSSATLGFVVRSRLPEEHKTSESITLVQIVTGLQVTFAALVLSLILTSSLGRFSTADRDRSAYAGQLTQLDQCFRNYGVELDAAREKLRSYTAAVIASTWPSETPPRGVAYPDTSKMPLIGEVSNLADLMNDISLTISALKPDDHFHEALAGRCSVVFNQVMERRWDVIDDARATISQPFYWMLVVWLMIVFGCLGLLARPNRTIMIVIVLCTVSVSSAMFVISDMQQPYGGYFGISSRSMQAALVDMLRPAFSGSTASP